MRRFDYTDAQRAHLVPVYDAPPSVGQRFGEALITGLGVGVAAGAAFYAAGYAKGDAVLGAVGVGAVGFLACWLRLLSLAWQRAEPQSEPEEPTERVILVNPPRADAEPVKETRLADFVRVCAEDTSTRYLESCGFSRTEQAEYRDALIKSGWARWRGRDKRLGWELAAEPEEILDALK